jgi:hypothetical protein
VSGTRTKREARQRTEERVSLVVPVNQVLRLRIRHHAEEREVEGGKEVKKGKVSRVRSLAAPYASPCAYPSPLLFHCPLPTFPRPRQLSHQFGLLCSFQRCQGREGRRQTDE